MACKIPIFAGNIPFGWQASTKNNLQISSFWIKYTVNYLTLSYMNFLLLCLVFSIKNCANNFVFGQVRITFTRYTVIANNT